MRIDEIDAAAAERQKARLAEIDIRRGRTRRKALRGATRSERVGKIRNRTGDCLRRIEADEGGAEEWPLAVKLKVILAFQHIVKHAEAAANAGLPAAARIPG